MLLVPENRLNAVSGRENAGEAQVKAGLEVPGFRIEPRSRREGVGWGEDRAAASGWCGWDKTHPKRPQVASHLLIRPFVPSIGLGWQGGYWPGDRRSWNDKKCLGGGLDLV